MTGDYTAEILRLRATFGDLLALSTIPAAWVGIEPPAIAAQLADVLIESLQMDFAFVRLCDTAGHNATEMMRGDSWKAFPEWLQQRRGKFSRTEILTNVRGVEEYCRGIVIPIGVNGERGLVAAACERFDFPNQIDQQLLSVAANNAATAFQNACLITELRSVQEALRNNERELRMARDDLENKVAARTSELQRSEQELRDVIDTIPAIVWSAMPDGSNTYVNRRFVEYSGMPAERMAGSGWQTATHPDDLPKHVVKWRTSLERGEPLDDEVRFRRVDGEYRWHLDRGLPLRDESGNIVKWYGVLTDIEDRKCAEQALRRSEAHLADGQRLSHTGSWAFNAAGFDYWSSELFRIHGLDTTGKPPTAEEYVALTHPEDREFVAQQIQKMLRDHCGFDFTKRIVRPDGKVRHVRCVGTPVTRDGVFGGFVGSAVDVTEQEQFGQERERLRQLEAELAHVNRISMMGEMAATLAHEVKQPIASARNNARAALNFLNRTPPDLGEVREAVGCIVGDADRAANIIDRIRDHIKKTPPRNDRFDLNTAVKEVIELAQSAITQHGVSVETRLMESLLPVQGDRVQLQQVVLNLVLNAVEAMRSVESGARELSISTEQDHTGGVLVAVRDSGPGIDPTHLDRVFEAFYTTKSGGVGMGLSICRSIIGAHGGRLWAEPNEPQGAIFRFTVSSAKKELMNSLQPSRRAGAQREDPRY